MEAGFLTVFGAGLLTVLSPCVLPILPIYVSLLVGEGLDEIGASRRRRLDLFLSSVFFLLGFVVVFSLLGLTASALGRALIRHRDLLQQLGGLLVFTFGLKFLGVLHIERMEEERRVEGSRFQTRFKWVNAFLLGFFFAFGWTPCVGPILGSVLTYTAVSTDHLWQGAFYLMVYALGLALPLLVLPFFFSPVLGFLRRAKRWIPRVERATGVILVIMGVLMVTGNLMLLDLSTAPADEPDVAVVAAHASTATGEPAAVMACDTKGKTSCDFDPDDPTREVPPFDASIKMTTVKGTKDLDAVLSGGEGKPVFVDFYSSNCPICRRMVPIIRTIEETCLDEDLVVLKINLSLAENRQFARRYGIVGVPTFLFLDEQGKEMSRLIGAQKIETLEESLAAATHGECRGFARLPKE
jgi:cytochrome c-type biogenesis protein